MPRKKAERELRVHVVNPDVKLDPDKMRQLAKWLLHWGIKEGIITPPWERGCTDDGEASGVAYYCPECYRRNRMAKGVRKR